MRSADAHVVSCLTFESKSLVNRRPENMLHLMRACDRMKVCGGSRMTGSVGSGSLFEFTSGCVGCPCGRAQVRGAPLARRESFRFSDGSPRARVIRMGRLKDRLNPSSAGCRVMCDLPEIIVPERDPHSARVPQRGVPPVLSISSTTPAMCQV